MNRRLVIFGLTCWIAGLAWALDATADTEGPVLVDANYIIVTCPGCPPPPTSPEIYILFDEAVDSLTASDPANYGFFETANPQNSISVAEVGFWPEWEPDAVTLLLVEVPPAVVHTLTVRDVQDTSGNVMAPDQFVFIEPGPVIPDAVPEAELAVPVLLPNIPNPFNPSTEIRFWLPETSGATFIRVTVWDLRGRKVRTLLQSHSLPSGPHALRWYGENTQNRQVASGQYIVRLETVEHVATQKITLTK